MLAASCLGNLKKKQRTSPKVCADGLKIRGGCLPWRYKQLAVGSDAESPAIELLIIEGHNSPGQHSFPAGSLEPGEEVAVCALRETQEEAGVLGDRGCWLGAFANRKKDESGGSLSHFFLLQVHTVQDPTNDYWTDPHSCWEGDGVRRRRWCIPEEARSLLKKDGPMLLDAFLSVPTEKRIDPAWRASARKHGSEFVSRILLLDKEVLAMRRHCSSHGRVLGAGATLLDQQNVDVEVHEAMPELTAGQKFAITAAAVWEADVIIAGGRPTSTTSATGGDLLLDSHKDRLLFLQLTSQVDEGADGLHDRSLSVAHAHFDEMLSKCAVQPLGSRV